MLSRPLTAAAAATLVLLPAPAYAAPTPGPCAAPQRYAAEAGAELFHVATLNARPLGVEHEPVKDVPVAATRTGMVAQSPVSSAAAARLLGAKGARGVDDALTRILTQQAPPDNADPAINRSTAAQVGPLGLGEGTSSAHARWKSGMACGSADSKVNEAEAALGSLTMLAGDKDKALLRVPGKLGSTSTTNLRRHDGVSRVVARSTVAAESFTLLDGQITVTMTKKPQLTVSMANTAEVAYVPPVLEVRGTGFAAQRLDTPGDEVELALAESKMIESAPSGPVSALLSGGGLRLPGLPATPGVPIINNGGTESTEPGDQPRLRLSLGEVRQAVKGHAAAARVVSVHIELVSAKTGRGKPGYTGGTVLDLNLGVLEAAAVAPEGGQGGGTDPAEAGNGALPITGVSLTAALIAAFALIIAGTAAFIIGRRRHTFRA